MDFDNFNSHNIVVTAVCLYELVKWFIPKYKDFHKSFLLTQLNTERPIFS